MGNGNLRVLVLLDNDIVVRNFVFSSAFEALTREHRVLFVLPLKTWRRLTVAPEEMQLGAPFVRVNIPPARIGLWRQLTQVGQLRLRRGEGHRGKRRIIRNTLGWKASALFTFYGLPGVFSLYRRRLAARLAALPSSEFAALLEREQPDVLIHPSTFEGYFINDFIEAGSRMRIPTVLIMNSWDNPSLKQAMAGQPDITVVWGEQTVRHAGTFMGVPREKTRILGAAQFDVFSAPPRLTREEFCREHGVDPQRKLLLYAGSSRNSDEFAHLRMLDDAIDSGKFDGAVSLIYRPHPWGKGGKAGERIVRHAWKHVVIERSMVAYLESVSAAQTTSFLNAEYQRTHDVLSNIDALISPMSTIILEAILHCKPTMCLLPLDESNRSINYRLGLDHFNELFRSPAMLVCRDTSELVEAAGKLLGRCGDERFQALLRREAEFFVKPSEAPYSESLRRLVEEFAAMKLANRSL